jgi:hypothetical protein
MPSICSVLPDEEEAASGEVEAAEVLVRDAQRRQGSRAPPKTVSKTQPRRSKRTEGETRNQKGASEAREHRLSIQRTATSASSQEEGEGAAYTA